MLFVYNRALLKSVQCEYKILFLPSLYTCLPLVHIIIVFVAVSGLGASIIDLNNVKTVSSYRCVAFPCRCYSAIVAYSYFILYNCRYINFAIDGVVK